MLLLSSTVLADDSQTFMACGGDEQTAILCFGDGQNSYVGLIPVAAFCGDSICNTNEDCHTCSPDCGSCSQSGSGSGSTTTPPLSNKRFFEFTYPSLTAKKTNDVLFTLAGPTIVYRGEEYYLQLIPTLNSATVFLDGPPKISVRNALNQKIVREANMQSAGLQGYAYTVNSGLIEEGIYKTIVSATYNHKTQDLEEEWQLRLSRDRLIFDPVDEVAPEVVCKLQVANEGEITQDFSVCYWLTSDAEGGQKESLNNKCFTTTLYIQNVSQEVCTLEEIKTLPLKKKCNAIEGNVLFTVPESPTYPAKYWCKTTTCRGQPPGANPELCNPPAVPSAAKGLLNVYKETTAKPIEIKTEQNLFDFLMEWGESFSPNHPSIAGITFLILAIILPNLFLIMISIGLVRNTHQTGSAYKKEIERLRRKKI